MRAVLPSVLMLATAFIPASTRAETSIALKSVALDLPDAGTMFAGPGSEALNDNCLTCHSSEMVLTQPPMSRTAWEAVVHKMMQAYKAPVDERDVAAIVDYLTRIKGEK
jgi:hypothetical protein